MLLQLATQAPDADVDAGVRGLATVSGWLAYAMMCLSLTWGVLVSAGWANRLAGRQALRSGHIMLSGLTLAFAFSHIISFLFLRAELYSVVEVFVPFNGGVQLRHTMGILAFEGMLAVSIVVGLRHRLSFRQWVGIHRLGYLAFGLGVVHTFVGAYNNGTLSVLWLLGITFLVPTVTVAVLRIMPARAMTSTGLFDEAP
ncbi:ferric reductase-like transmembrane domain-containing protein [Actinophytocola sp.]|uniref:ferric reductase-like transmembrane domain-containing protein n=1 Tax=Actinophytocola sp. TaxID=1872138 RepID=UPI003D6AB992